MSRNLLAIRIWLTVMVIAVSLTGTSAFAQGATAVRVDPSALSAQVNDNVNLSVKVDNIANLAAFELHLSFNPGVLEVIAITNGGFVVADFIAQNTFDNTAGTIDYAVAQMNRAPAQGSGTLLNLVFRAKGNGNSTVTLRATQAVPSGMILSDPNGMAIQVPWMGGSVSVGTPASITSTLTIPAPSSTPTFAIPPSSTPTSVIPGPSSTPTPVVIATNTPTAITISTPIPPVPPGAVLGTHVVRFGEWLFCIGRAYGVSPWAIADANGIWWPYIIFPNQRLTIPNVPWINSTIGPVCQPQFSVSSSPPIAATAIPTTIIPTTFVASATAIPPTSCRAYYTVRPGDTLYQIALSYGTSYPEIARVNQLSNPRLIYPGQQLCIP